MVKGRVDNDACSLQHSALSIRLHPGEGRRAQHRQRYKWIFSFILIRAHSLEIYLRNGHRQSDCERVDLLTCPLVLGQGC